MGEIDVTCIWGDIRTGKTAWGVREAYCAQERGIKVSCNMPLVPQYFPDVHLFKFPKLKRRARGVDPELEEGEENPFDELRDRLVFIDEAHMSLDSHLSMTYENIERRWMILQIGKCEIDGLVFVTQYFDNVEKTLRNMTNKAVQAESIRGPHHRRKFRGHPCPCMKEPCPCGGLHKLERHPDESAYCYAPLESKRCLCLWCNRSWITMWLPGGKDFKPKQRYVWDRRSVYRMYDTLHKVGREYETNPRRADQTEVEA